MTQPIAQNTTLITLIADYESLATVDQYQQVLNDAAAGNVSNAVISGIENLTCDLQPLINKFSPPANTSPIWTDYLQTHMDEILPEDYSIFVQIYNQCQGYVSKVNEFISAANTANSYLGTTFTGVDALTSGGFSSVAGNLVALGNDFAAQGQVIDFANLNELGYPSRLLTNIRSAGNGYIGFQEQLIAAGFTENEIYRIGRDPGYDLTLTVERQIYTAMQNTVGTQLTDILEILDCTLTGITSLADLLDPAKIFPTSRGSLTAPTALGLVAIYQNNTTSLNDQFAGLGRNFSPATSQYLAAANAAVARSLNQIKNATGLTASAAAGLCANVELMTGLANVTSQTSALLPSAATTFNNLATGSGPGNLFVIGDFVGSVAGYPLNDYFPAVTSNVGNILAANVAYPLTSTDSGNLGVFTVMINTIAGDYDTGNTVVLPAPYGGTYGNINEALTALTSSAQSRLDSVNTVIAAQYTTDSANAQTAWTTMVDWIAREKTNQANASVNLAQITHQGPDLIFSWVQNFSSAAQDTQPGGANTVISGVIDSTSESGQMVEGALREARNINQLNNNGITPDNQIGSLTPMLLNVASLIGFPPGG